MADVFVSYKAEDRRRVRPLVEALEADGHSVWWDAQIGGGAAWRHEIEGELNSAKSVIVVWSKRSVGPDGGFVQDEASRAQQRRVYVPVTIDKVRVPLGFGETQALPLAGWHGDRADARYRAVLSAVRRVLGEAPRRPAMPAERKGPVSRRVLLAGAIAAAAAGGLGAWRWVARDRGSAARSIAVLPFANLSGDPAQSYFSDGIAEEIRSALARIARLQVVARTSSELVRNDDPETAARKLHVANILMGSVRRSASLIRVSAQLVDPKSGVERWSAVYDRAPGDILQIQTDIAQKVAEALSLQLAPVKGNLLTIGGTANPQAQELFLKAVALRESGLDETVLKGAIQLLGQAITIDDQYAQAYAQRGRMAAELSGYFPAASDYMKGYTQAVADARKAIRIAPQLPAGYASLGIAHELGNEFADALREYQRAVSYPSVDADTIATFGGFLAQLGFMARALSLADRAIAIDPLNSRPYDVRSTAYFFGRRYNDALSSARAVLQMAPNDRRSLTVVGYSLVQMGQIDAALATFRQVPPGDFRRLVGEAIAQARVGNRADSDRLLDQLRRTSGDAADYQQAEILTQQKDFDGAFAALDRALATRDPGLIYLLSDPFLDDLRKDGRFKPFAAKLNIPAPPG